MDAATVTETIADQLVGMADENDDLFSSYSLDVGEIFLRSPDGKFFLLGVTEVDAATVSFIEDDDWS